jgi:L-threonylcarbamoyladenylate synthase
VPDEVTAGLKTVAIRMPAHPIARALIDAASVPVAAPSANLFSRPSPTRASHVLDDLNGLIDIVIDGGTTTVGIESTVLDLSGDVPTILRPGAVTLEMLGEVLPAVRSAVRATLEPADVLPSPGMLERHYSPRAPLRLYVGPTAAMQARLAADAAEAISAGKSVGILAADEDPFAIGFVIRVGPLHEPSTIASRLYSALRELDAAGVDLILARGFPDDTGLGAAIRDRLQRAAAGRVVVAQ